MSDEPVVVAGEQVDLLHSDESGEALLVLSQQFPTLSLVEGGELLQIEGSEFFAGEARSADGEVCAVSVSIEAAEAATACAPPSDGIVQLRTGHVVVAVALPPPAEHARIGTRVQTIHHGVVAFEIENSGRTLELFDAYGNPL